MPSTYTVCLVTLKLSSALMHFGQAEENPGHTQPEFANQKPTWLPWTAAAVS